MLTHHVSLTETNSTLLYDDAPHYGIATVATGYGLDCEGQDL
jgi:hypothetical protein